MARCQQPIFAPLLGEIFRFVILEHSSKSTAARRIELEAWLLVHARRAEVRGGCEVARRPCSRCEVARRPGEASAVIHSGTCENLPPGSFFVWVSIVLLGSGSAQSDSVNNRLARLERPEHAPRSPAWAQTCAVLYTRASLVPHSRERDKIPAGGREKLANVQKKLHFIHTYT